MYSGRRSFLLLLHFKAKAGYNKTADGRRLTIWKDKGEPRRVEHNFKSSGRADGGVFKPWILRTSSVHALRALTPVKVDFQCCLVGVWCHIGAIIQQMIAIHRVHSLHYVCKCIKNKYIVLTIHRILNPGQICTRVLLHAQVKKHSVTFIYSTFNMMKTRPCTIHRCSEYNNNYFTICTHLNMALDAFHPFQMQLRMAKKKVL